MTRWAAVAFGAGIGIGSAYTECAQKFDGFPTRFMESPKATALQVILLLSSFTYCGISFYRDKVFHFFCIPRTCYFLILFKKQ